MLVTSQAIGRRGGGSGARVGCPGCYPFSTQVVAGTRLRGHTTLNLLTQADEGIESLPLKVLSSKVFDNWTHLQGIKREHSIPFLEGSLAKVLDNPCSSSSPYPRLSSSLGIIYG